MRDATGVRCSSDLQARLTEELRAVVRENHAHKLLRVLLGHTSLEVAVEVLIGLLGG